jgi:putative heme-binding domain-containing protein
MALAITTGQSTPATAQRPAPVEDVSSFPAHTPQDERKRLHVPPGFDLQLVASEPDIHKPLNLAFDDRGRLWITDTVEYPYGANAGSKPRDTVKILSDFGPEGRARKIETFADGLNIPIGLLPLPSATAALVHSIPDIFLIRDSDGDGRADSRAILYGVFGHRDTHGMTNAFTWGFDGWVYACHGYANDSSVEGKDKRPIRMNSGNTYRMRPDGSHAEYFTHGQVNPFGLAFDPLGNLYSCDCHSRPVYQLLRGAWYPSFGKPDDGIGFGPEMVTYDHGSTGIAGISYYAADQFPAAYSDTVFIGNVVTNRINHDKIQWLGSTPRGIEQPDFVWSEDNWFRPVDIELGPDGALYVADFYNRIIGHYEVPLTHPGRDRTSGRIWRIVYRGIDGEGDAPAPPGNVDRTRSSVEELAEDLNHPNLTVRMSASNQLVARGGDSAVTLMRKALGTDSSTRRRVHAMWVLQRLGQLGDEALLVLAQGKADRELRVHALKVMVERRELSGPLRDLAIARLSDADPFVRRAAADVLGAHPQPENIKPLLALWQATPAEDTHLVHVARMALRDQFRQPDTWARLQALNVTERDRRDIADVATGVPSPEAATFMLAHLLGGGESAEKLVRFMHHIARYGARGSTTGLLQVVESAGRGPAEKLVLLRMIQRGAEERGEGLDERIRAAAQSLARTLLRSNDPGQVGLAIEAVRDFQFRDELPTLRAMLDRADLSTTTRIDSLKALVALDGTGSIFSLDYVLKDQSAPRKLRECAATLLANQESPKTQAIVLNSLPTAPGWLQDVIASILAKRKGGAEALLNLIETGKASPRLLQERQITIGLESARIDRVNERIDALLKGLPTADEKLKDLMDRRRVQFLKSTHDLSQGARAFEKNCGICHQLEGKGAKVGPQLDGIGSRGLDRLLEDIIDPNRNIDQNFRVTNLALNNGQIVSGLLLREEGDVLVLADSQGKEVRVLKSTVEERSTAQLSPMPANLVEQIAEPEFYDLMAYLLEHREEKAPR